ncbi:MAG: hypothetical protein Q4E70_03735 [Candidatus Saccharibacteria bacterium]|nr:hypothetical protein [Candidatus Saccharibacteria bacterium]
MSKTSDKKNLTPLYIFFVLLFSVGITFLVLSLIMPPKKNDNNDNTLTTTVNSTELEAKVEQGGSSQTPKQNEDEHVSDSEKLDISLSKNEIKDGKYQIRVTIFEILTETGTCELEMKSSNGDYVKRSAKTINAGPDSTSCDGFDIKTEGIASGLYDFTLTVTVGSRTGVVTGNIKV